MIIAIPWLSKSSVFQIVLFPQLNQKPAFLNSSGLKSVFDMLRFRDGLVQMCPKKCLKKSVEFLGLYSLRLQNSRFRKAGSVILECEAREPHTP